MSSNVNRYNLGDLKVVETTNTSLIAPQNKATIGAQLMYSIFSPPEGLPESVVEYTNELPLTIRGQLQDYVRISRKSLRSTYGKRVESNNFQTSNSTLHPFYLTGEAYTQLSGSLTEMFPDGSYASHMSTVLGTFRFQILPEDPGAIGREFIPELSDDELILQLAGRLNPSRPYIDAPLALFELRDVPKMLTSLRNLFKENPAGTYLGLEFGVKPMVKDLRKLLQHGKEIEKRLRTIHRMASGKSITRSSKKFPHIETKTEVYPVTFTFAGRSYEIEIEETWTESRWVVLHYKYDQLIIPNLPEDQYALAERVTRGLSVNGSFLWNAFPWSWMIDWVSSLGDAIDAARNSIGASLDKVSLMRHRTHTINVLKPPAELKLYLDAYAIVAGVNPGSVYWDYSNPDAFFWDAAEFGAEGTWSRLTPHGSFTMEEKRRIVGPPPEPQTNLDIDPILGDKWKVSILGALATVAVLGR